MLTGIVEQTLTDILPDRVRTVEPGGVGLLDFDDPGASTAGDPKAWCWISARRCVRTDGPGGLDPVSARGSSRTACQYSGGISSPGPSARAGGTFPRTAAAFASISMCFGVGMRQLAGRSVNELNVTR